MTARPADQDRAGLDTWRLLAAALAGIDQLATLLADTDAEAAALRAELDQTNRGMLALYAELSDHQEQLEHARADAERASQASRSTGAPRPASGTSARWRLRVTPAAPPPR